MKAENDGKDKKEKNTFLTDIGEIRRRARQHIEDGAVTDTYKGDRKVVLRVLNEALATEIVCVLRYKRHHYMAKGIHSQAVAEEFLEHAAEEQEHADLIAERITQLDGEPNFNPEGLLTRSHSEYVEGESLDRHDSRGSDRGKDRHRILLRNHPIPCRQRSDQPAVDGRAFSPKRKSMPRI